MASAPTPTDESLTKAAHIYGHPIRAAVGILSSAVGTRPVFRLSELMATNAARHHEGCSCSLDAELAAWGMVSIWATGVVTGNLAANATLSEAEEWFLVADSPARLSDLWSRHVMREAEKALPKAVDLEAGLDMLPYIFDPYGPGSRASVMRDPATASARIRKRADGIFYTPVDVARYMVENSFASLGSAAIPTVYDPACGTGVFLKAGLRALQSRGKSPNSLTTATQHLFGTDIAPWPLDASAFVLLAEILMSDGNGVEQPYEIWRKLRQNLRQVDALTVQPFSAADERRVIGGTGPNRLALSELFPSMRESPTVIVGNPPYADIGELPYSAQIVKSLKTMRVKPKLNAEVYVGFVEQMIRLANQKRFSGCLVLPLSVAYSIGPQFITVRQIIQQTAGQWRFAFFDREPQALFGEDVKTRNAIAFWNRDEASESPIIFSGPLRRWRRPSRSSMFERIKFTEIPTDIQSGIPKLEGCQQVSAFETLRNRWDRLERAVLDIGRASLAEALVADDRSVFVGNTAYNFLNVFLRPSRSLLPPETRLSENPLHEIRCGTTTDALAVFGMLTSHLAYWLWQTYGDGFHVSRRFLTDFPFGVDILENHRTESLATIGAKLWSDISLKPVISLNRGRTSLGYDPSEHTDLRTAVDTALVDAAGIERGFVEELQRCTELTRAASY